MARASKQNQGPDEASDEPVPEPNWGAEIEFLRGLASIVRDEELSELVVEQAGVRLSLRSRRPSIVPPDPAPALPALALPALALPLASLGVEAGPASEGEEVETAREASQEEAFGTPIVSPMVGVFFRSKTPDDPPFVSLGERVEVGQVIGLVEAMKTFNEILSEVEGDVIALPARNGEEVQAGAPLVVVR